MGLTVQETIGVIIGTVIGAFILCWLTCWWCYRPRGRQIFEKRRTPLPNDSEEFTMVHPSAGRVAQLTSGANSHTTGQQQESA